MNWKKFMNEGDYQDFLLRALTDGKKGFEAFVKRTNADFCREYAMDKGLLIEFLEATQPETMSALSKLYKARRDATFSKSYTELEHLEILEEIEDDEIFRLVPEYEELKKLCGKAVGIVNYDVLETSDSPWYYEGNIPWKVSRPRWFKKPFDVCGFVGMWRMKPADARKVLKAL